MQKSFKDDETKFTLSQVVIRRWLMKSFLAVVGLSLSGCVLTKLAIKNAGSSIDDSNASRLLSDSVADDLLQDRRGSIGAKFEEDFRKSVAPKEFDSVLSEMFRVYGKPLEFEFKQDELGSKSYSDSKIKPMRRFWYAARTTKYEKGSYFLIVEVVPDDGGLAVSSFSMVNFPLGVPLNLR
jgi:hypothetical protein